MVFSRVRFPNGDPAPGRRALRRVGRYTARWKRATLQGDRSAQAWVAIWTIGSNRFRRKQQLSSEAAYALHTDGFIVLPGPVPAASLAELAHLYDEAVSCAAPDDIKVGSTTTRVRDFVNRDAAFDELYLYPPMLQACCRVIGQPFKLSTMHARTVRRSNPRTAAPCGLSERRGRMADGRLHSHDRRLHT